MPGTQPTSTSGHTEHSERFKNRDICQYRNYKPFDDKKCGSNSCCRLGTRVTHLTLALAAENNQSIGRNGETELKVLTRTANATCAAA